MFGRLASVVIVTTVLEPTTALDTDLILASLPAIAEGTYCPFLRVTVEIAAA